jgi:uncharacterized protein (DUF1800 family)
MAADVALLLRRAGFGPTAGELAKARRAGYPTTLSLLMSPTGPDTAAAVAPVPDLGLDPFAGKTMLNRREEATADGVRDVKTAVLTRWWLDRMTVADHQATEKLLFFWHGHWATSIRKVRSPQLMLAQHRTLRDARDFVAMARRMVVDPALVNYLDGHQNTAAAPNENLARELMEVFTLGNGNYTENDVKAAGRALTGWRFSLTFEKCLFDAADHDSGDKTILGVTAPFTARGLIDLLLAQPACPRFIAARLWSRYASSTEPIPAALRERMTDAFPHPSAMLQVLFTDDAFGATTGALVKQPIEWLVGAMRQLGLRPARLPTQDLQNMLFHLDQLGQYPFAPPNVGGWPAGSTWLTSSAAQVRLTLAALLARLAEPTGLTPESLAHLLAVDRWTSRTHAVLREVREPRRLLILGLVSPEYLVT